MEALEKLVAKYTKVQLVRAKVTEVSGDVCTAMVSDESKTFFKVGLNAVLTNAESKKLSYPKVGSWVILAVIDGNTTANIISFSEVDKTYFKTGTTVSEVDAEGHRIERENETLREALNDLIDEINKIKVIYGNTINVPEMLNIKTRINKILK
ncbi:MAG: hypothetical protein ABGW88_13670 [Leeuwenhoekiella sp.]|uniref:hypothetical protein n=1 Tax=Leeuwenhoekiella sp. TaxID=1977054 RepID=UPI003242C7A2